MTEALLEDELTIHETLQIIRVLSQNGVTIQDLRRLLSDPHYAQVAGRMLSEWSRQLVHGVFSPTDRVLDAFKRQNFRAGWGFSEEDFERLPPPPRYQNDKNIVVILFGMLEATERESAIERTFRSYWEWIEQRFPQVGMEISDKDEGVILPSCIADTSAYLHQGTLSWVRLKLDANRQRAPQSLWQEAAGEKTGMPLAGLENLAMAAEHPEWVLGMGADERPNLFLSGLCFELGSGSTKPVRVGGLGNELRHIANWNQALALYRNVSSGSVELQSVSAEVATRKWASPIVLDSFSAS